MEYGVAVTGGRRNRRKAGGRGFPGPGFLFLAALFVLPAGGSLYGQTAADMERLMDSREITCAQACRFVLPAAGALDENAGTGAAFAAARERGWLPRGAAEEDAVKLGDLSFLVLQSFSLKKSFLAALFPGPRYAYRQLDYLGLIPGVRDPSLKVSGERLLQILGRVLSYRGDEEEGSEWGEISEAALPPLEAAEPSEALREEREQIVREIQTELETGNVEDTTVRAVDEGIVISLNNIQFMPDDTELTEGERIKLMRIGVILAAYPTRHILVGGHTALAGSAAGRMLISTRRAQAVADFLVYLDVRRPEEIVVRGYGAEQPLGAGDTAADRALNRRVEIILLDEEF
jgi:outer membrane protein OmpA-like peptidoglycan-associated protein